MSELFADMLVGNEAVHCVLGAPGVREGEQNVWFQVALTDYRILVVKMVAVDGAADWRSAKRWALNRDSVQIGQYPRTVSSSARLEIEGFPEPVHLVDIDRSDLHPHIAPFLETWSRPVQGVASIAQAPDVAKEPKLDERVTTDNTLLYVLVGGGALMVFCCGGSVVLRTLFGLLGLLG